MFHSPTCGYCKKAMPEFIKLSTDTSVQQITKLGLVDWYEIVNLVNSKKIFANILVLRDFLNLLSSPPISNILDTKAKKEQLRFSNNLFLILD